MVLFSLVGAIDWITGKLVGGLTALILAAIICGRRMI